MKKYSKQDQRALAAWAAKCAERVLPLFEQAHPEDERPRNALEACRAWVRSGEFKMAMIRGAALSAHAAARGLPANDPAGQAAHAAGQAVATAHVAQHAYGGAYYALRAIAAADPENAEKHVVKEREWQGRQLPKHLREEIMDRITIHKRGGKIVIKLRKGEGF
jgi:hypothetical protein